MALVIVEICGEAVVGDVEGLAALVVTPRAHRALELRQVAVRPLQVAEPSFARGDQFRIRTRSELADEIAALQLVLA